MPIPRYSRADFRAALHALLPTGRIWPREADTVQARVLDGLAAVYERQTDDAIALLQDAFPTSAQSLLPEWEATLGLDVGETLRERQYAVRARITAIGGQSHPYFIGLAEALGYPGATVTDFGGLTVESPCDRALDPDPWCHVWRLHVPDDGGLEAMGADGLCDAAVRSWGRPRLEAEVRRVAPAHTHVLFGYGAATVTPPAPPIVPWDDGMTVWDFGTTQWVR